MEVTEDMKRMARRICAQIVEGDSDNPLRVSAADSYLNGRYDERHEMRAVIAAIMETSELRSALESARHYVSEAVDAAGGIDACEIHMRHDLEAIDRALAGAERNG